MNKNTAETRYRLRQARVQFLRERPHLLQSSEQIICIQLKAAGLLAQSTYWRDAHIDHLIEEAKQGYK